MRELAGWACGSHTAGRVTHPTYRKGAGPGVVIVHEIPGITPEVLRFADEVVDRGFTVVLPHLFGDPGASASGGQIAKAIAQVCVSREFTKLRAGVASPVTDWLRSLARSLNDELGGPGVGALGMCLTGGFALAMMVDDCVAAPVVAQPALPAPLGKTRAADLGLSPAAREVVRRRVAAGCPSWASATARTLPSAPGSTRSPTCSGMASSRSSSRARAMRRSRRTANRSPSTAFWTSSTSG